MDKMEQRLAVSAAIGAGSHIPGPAPVPSHETGGQRHQQHLEEAAGQLECMTQEAPPADPDAAQLLNAHGLMLCLPDPLLVGDAPSFDKMSVEGCLQQAV